MAQHVRNAATTAVLSSLSQPVGYFATGAGPVLFGWLHEIDGGWWLPFAVIFVGLLCQLLSALSLHRERMVLSPHP